MEIKVNKNLMNGSVVGGICDLTLYPSEKFDGWELSDEQANYLKIAQAVTITLMAMPNEDIDPRTIDNTD